MQVEAVESSKRPNNACMSSRYIPIQARVRVSGYSTVCGFVRGMPDGSGGIRSSSSFPGDVIAGAPWPSCLSSMMVRMLQTLLAGFAERYLANPLRLENLRGSKASCRVRIQNGVDDVAATGLWSSVSHLLNYHPHEV